MYIHICKGAVCLCTLHIAWKYMATKTNICQQRVQCHVVCTCPACGSHISIFGGIYSTSHQYVPSALVSQLKEESQCLVLGQPLCTLVIGSSNNNTAATSTCSVLHAHVVVSTSYMAG